MDERIDSMASRFGKQEDVDTIEGTEFVAGAMKCVNAETSVERGSMLLTKITDKKELAKFKAAKKGDKVVFNPKKAFNDESETELFTGAKKDNTAAMEADYEITLEAVKLFTKSEVNQELFDKVYGKDAVKSEEEFQTVEIEMEENYA